MQQFEISIKIASGQMVCASCSTTIRTALEKYLNDQNISFEYVAANFKTSTIDILLELDNTVALDDIKNKLKAEIESTGFNCESSVESAERALIADTTIVTKTQQKQWMYAIPFLGFGVGLMLSEHFAWIPSPTKPNGIPINLAIGSVSTAMTFVAGRDYFLNSLRFIKAKKLSGGMDYLISLGSLSALIYSFLLIGLPSTFGKISSATFFSVPLVILGLLKISHALRDHFQNKIESQMDMLTVHKKKLPATADIICLPNDLVLSENTDLNQFPIQHEHVRDVQLNSLVKVLPGNVVPIDGTFMNQDSLSVKEDFFGKKGETVKQHNDPLYAGTINTSQSVLFLKTTCLVKDNIINTAYSNVRKTTENSQNKLLTKISTYFFPAILSVASVSAVFWGVFGPSPSAAYAIQVFLSVIFSACPCAFGFIEMIPSVSKMLAFNQGILIRNDSALFINEATDICLDKCGTLTTGKYILEDVYLKNGNQDKNLKNHYLSYAVILENQIDKNKRSAVAEAIIETSQSGEWNLNLNGHNCTHFKTNPINGDKGGTITIGTDEIIVGNRPLLENQKVIIDAYWSEKIAVIENSGKLAVLLAVNKQVAALLILNAVEEKQQILRPHTQKAITWLADHGKTLHLLTGDSQARAELLVNLLKNECGDRISIAIQAESTPTSKVNYIKALQDNGRSVIMVGDDSNDLPALKQANFGIAIDTLTSARAEACAILNNSLYGLVQLSKLSTSHRYNNVTAIAIAFCFNSAAVLFSSGVLYPATGSLLNPMIMGGIMAASSLFLMTSIFIFQRLGQYELQKNIDNSLNLFSPTKYPPKNYNTFNNTQQSGSINFSV